MKNVFAINSLGWATSSNQLGKLLAAGPITKQPSTMPYRIVLVELSDKFAVGCETFESGVEKLRMLPSNGEVESSLNAGQYFPLDKFVQATIHFAKRLERHAENYYESVYREETAPA